VIIVIGAGRSGSTLLTRILNEHPNIKFGGETDFLAPRLWAELWENRFWFHWKMQAESLSPSGVSRRDNQSLYNLRSETDLEIPTQVMERSRQKVTSVIQSVIKTLLDTEDSLVWGYKEPWNGSESFLYEWKIYDNVFPNAMWLHLVRDPFSFVKSCSQWVRHNLDMSFLTRQLNEWVGVVKFSRERNATRRYYEIRFEDLIHTPQKVLQPVLDSFGLRWSEACLGPLQKPVMKSNAADLKDDNSALTLGHIGYLFKHIEGLEELCKSLNYVPKMAIPNYFASFEKEGEPIDWRKSELNLRQIDREAELSRIASEREAELSRIASMREPALLDYLKSYALFGEKALKRTILEKPYQQDIGQAWAVSLTSLRSIADNEEYLYRSPLLLFEDDVLLQPAHAMHEDIRNMGRGCYSHWNETLFFSTSDNSNPNTNGRIYRIVYST